MKALHSMLASMLVALSATTRALDNAEPVLTAAAAPAKAEIQEWLATTNAQWQATFKREVTDAHERELARLKLQYQDSLEAAITKTSGVGDLDNSLAIRTEEMRFSDTKVFLEHDDIADVDAVKQLRTAIRTQIAQLEKDTAIRIKTLHTKYDQVLEQAQTELTQGQRLDDALLVKKKREEVAAAWNPSAGKTAGEKTAVAVKTENRNPAANPAPTARTKTQKGNSSEAIDGFFVGKTWQSPTGIKYTFEKDGTCLRQFGHAKTTLRWHHFGTNAVEVTGKKSADTQFFRFVSATEAYCGRSENDIKTAIEPK